MSVLLAVGGARVRHAEVAEEARLYPGTWITAGHYETRSAANKAVRGVRSGEIRAYRPQGAYAAVVQMVDGRPGIAVRYAGHPATPRLDMRTVEEVYVPRAGRSENPDAFRAHVAHALDRYASGEDLATEAWTHGDPIRLAAEIEALAGLRRLRLFRQNAQSGGAA
ncbi:hypothetical protein [Streptomyces cinereoruber]|uniref:hypothetical protein n=1 Tax=Streptomyces cinereoruber TaxID=67260 RepID=UPI003627E26F